MRNSERTTISAGRQARSSAGDQGSTELDTAQRQALAEDPYGAVAVAGLALVLLLIGWLQGRKCAEWEKAPARGAITPAGAARGGLGRWCLTVLGCLVLRLAG